MKSLMWGIGSDPHPSIQKEHTPRNWFNINILLSLSQIHSTII
jgi:hypothetical protein